MIEDILSTLKYNNIQLQPCSDEDIVMLEDMHGIKLPVAYKQFLAVAGRGADTYMAGSDWEYEKLDSVNREAIALLACHGCQDLPDKAFICWMHQGYQFAFFVCDGNDDPAIFYYNETAGRADFVQTYDRLSDWLYDELVLASLEIPG
ncbi:SMI1/KNR4 family protein [Chitinophaga varians]|uniref:SMI1/KNR4 family protein n=1 Tax=Chitinophaga varians TaxID=2202339 RepID=UPI00165F6634|nr:SMI1/KNR4 family protein [Chitinophaga varians]MBC9914081.1 SMI1/KNR4 family protein [Chitinophaga varians]